MKTASVEIKSLSPLLMHRFPMVPVEGLEKKSREEQAELAAYRIPDGTDDSGELYVPGSALQRMLVGSAAFSKGKGRSTLQKTVAACVFVTPEYLTLGVKEFAIDSRPVVVPATRGRVLRHRPRLDKWGCKFTIEWDELLLNEEQVRKVVDDAGSRVGLLDYRPACKGPFGRFSVVGWKV